MSTENQPLPQPRPQIVDVEVRGKNSTLFKAAALFAAGIAASAAIMAPDAFKISDAIDQLHVRNEQARRNAAAENAPLDGNRAVTSSPARAKPAERPTPALSEVDKARAEVLNRPVPSDTKAAAEITRATPAPKDGNIQMPSAEQTQVLGYGVFAPIAARVFSNVTKQKETHWTLHPWDVARLADQAAAELFKEKRIRVEPRLIAGAYYTESAGVVQMGFDRKGVNLINKGKSVDDVVKSGAKASFGLFQIDQQHSGAKDIDPLRGAKRAGELLAEGQDNLRQFPQLGMLAVSATYNASSKLRAKIFTNAPMDERELEAFDSVRRHAASMSYGAAMYDLAHRTYQQHLMQAHRMGLPIAMAADKVKRADPLKDERIGAVYALTGRQMSPQSDRAQWPTQAVATIASQPSPSLIQVLRAAPAPAAAAKPIATPAVVATAAQPKATETPRSRLVATSVQRHAVSKPPAARPPQGEFVGGRMNGVDFGNTRVTRVSEVSLTRQAENIMPPAQRVRSAFQATTNEWRNTSSDLLGRVTAFHQQRTREMATQSSQREAP